MEFKRIAVDTSKAVFTVHGVDERGRPILRENLTRARFERFLGKMAPTEVVLEACGSSHHWGRFAQELGHTVRLIPPQYVKPFVKRGKNDRNDAEAISEAASRPSMRFVPVKSAEAQAEAMDLSARDLLVRQRTQLVNAVRGHAAEFGVIAAKGIAQIEPLLAKIAAADMPQAAKDTLAHLGRVVTQLDAQLAELDQRLAKQHKANPVSQRLATVPGVGPTTALTMAVRVDPGQFESARHFAAWLGLTPREHSTGGRQHLGGISRAGDERLRQLLVVGAMAVIRHARPGSKTASPWLLALLERRPRKLAAVALANKMARILWAMMTNGTAYRRTPQAA
ncbi:MAG: IS110 family transposase [Candidatus Eremiobacteraeota bacterium]|nr:IS110 family transposase [Candidatus Eremiobacteraeota bacterium]